MADNGTQAPQERRDVFTTGQVAKMCKVATRTVAHWVDRRQLRGYHIPGSQDRRVPRGALIKFLRENGMLSILSPQDRRMLGLRVIVLVHGPLVGADTLVAQVKALVCKASHDLEIVPITADSSFAVGMRIPTSAVALVLLDSTAPVVNGETQCHSAKTGALWVRFAETGEISASTRCTLLAGNELGSATLTLQEVLDLVSCT